ncbi:F-box only protein 9 [Aspergillus hancockii]|nr:F-box only protein 9 [Aspergillus hancockii]
MEDNAELESFRRQWREEVSHRTKQNKPTTLQPKPTSLSVRPSPFPPARHQTSQHRVEEDGAGTASFDNGELVQGVRELSLADPNDEEASRSRKVWKEPKSALEHFERAVEKEAEGNLGDSLQHYRKAYRLDSAVDKTYRNKHFAWAWKKPAQAPADIALKGQQAQDEPRILPTPDLIASFAHIPISQVEPIIKNDTPPPCPIANVPSEVIVEILRHVALMDPIAFCRMSQVCKRLAWHFAHEQHVWKRLCQGSEFGFKAMHYSFACDLYGNPEHTLNPRPRYTPFPIGSPVQVPEPLSSWSDVFQMFPRIRFTGIYISTCNYTRAGAASFYQNISWNSPIHIVTYYRYIRFYPDGTVLFLLTTAEPLEVVPHISMGNAQAVRAACHKHQRQIPGSTLPGASEPLPTAAMEALKGSRRGRWRLANPFPLSDTGPSEDAPTDTGLPSVSGKVDASDPRDVIIETESVSPSSVNVLHLSLRSSSAHKSTTSIAAPTNSSKNTKLAWKGYYSYNKLTDDWGEYGLRNDRAFVFRRVRGWGMN